MTSRNRSKDWVYILIGFVLAIYLITGLNYSFDIIGGTLGQLWVNNLVDFVKIDYEVEMTRLNNGKVRADDKMLVEIIKRFYIEPPSTLPYSLKYPEVEDPSLGQAAVVDRALNYLVRSIFTKDLFDFDLDAF